MASTSHARMSGIVGTILISGPLMIGFVSACLAGSSAEADQSAWSACRAAPTRRCALDHAVDLARTSSPSQVRAMGLAQIARAQADAGLPQQASATVNLLSPDEAAQVAGSVARIKAAAGKLDEAMRLADRFGDPNARGLVTGSIAIAEGETGQIDAALRRVRALEDPVARAVAIRRAAWGLRTIAVQRGDDGKIADALREVELIRIPMSLTNSHPSTQKPAMEIIVDAQLRAGKIDEAVKAAQSARYDRAQTFAAILCFLTRTGRATEALRLALAIGDDQFGALQFASDPGLMASLSDFDIDPDGHSELETLPRQSKIAPDALAVAKSFSEPARSMVLRMLAEADADADDAAQALDAAKLIGSSDERLSALLSVGKAQARTGQRGPAGESFDEALRIARSSVPPSGSMIAKVATAQAEADRIDEARALVASIDDQWSRNSVMSEIGRALARAGKTAEAQKTADTSRSSAPLVDPDQAIVRGFAEGGHIDDAVQTAKAMKQNSGEGALYLATVALCDAGQVTNALQLARAIAPGVLQVETLVKVARALRQAGAESEAASTIREAFNVAAVDSNPIAAPSELVALSRILPD